MLTEIREQGKLTEKKGAGDGIEPATSLRNFAAAFCHAGGVRENSQGLSE
jgi:hypothetical protein